MEEIHRRIPHRPPFLFIDEIVEINENGATAKLSVKPDFSFFEGHYPGNPIMPGVLLCESVFQTGAIFLADFLKNQSLTDDKVTPVLSRIRDARFKRMVLPGDEIEIKVSLKDQIGQFKIQWDGTNKFGQQMSSGVYFIQLSTKTGIIRNKKMMLLK